MLISIVIVIIAIVILTATITYYVCRCRQKSCSPYAYIQVTPVTKVSEKWDASTHFNPTNYAQCCRLIDYIYTLYTQSLSSVLNENDIQNVLYNDHNIDQATMIMGLDNIIQPIDPIQTITCIVGRIASLPTIGIIAFRGTESDQEWLSNAASLLPHDLSTSLPTKQSYNIGDVTDLPFVDPSRFAPDTVVGRGWFDLYCRKQGARTRSGCFCRNECKTSPVDNKYYCPIMDQYSHIGDGCKPKTCQNSVFMCDECISSDGTSGSMADQVWSAVQSLLTKGVTSFIFTGHSLGGSLATLASTHISYGISGDYVHSVYTFASPRVGNKIFVDQYNTNVAKMESSSLASKILRSHAGVCYRVANLFDLVPHLPPHDSAEMTSWLNNKLVKKYIHSADLQNIVYSIEDYIHVGSPVYTYVYYEKGWGIAQYHSLMGDYYEKGMQKLF